MASKYICFCQRTKSSFKSDIDRHICATHGVFWSKLDRVTLPNYLFEKMDYERLNTESLFTCLHCYSKVNEHDLKIHWNLKAHFNKKFASEKFFLLSDENFTYFQCNICNARAFCFVLLFPYSLWVELFAVSSWAEERFDK